MKPVPDFQQLFRLSPYPYLVVDAALNIVDANDAYLRTVGRKVGDLVGRYVFEAFPENPDDPGSTNLATVRASMLRAVASGEAHTIPFLRYSVSRATPEGPVFEERYWSTVHTPLTDADGKVAFVMQNSTDVTSLYRFDPSSQQASVEAAPPAPEPEQTHSQAQMHQAMTRILNDERSHLRGVFNQAPGFIAVLSGPNHVFEMVNEAYYQLVGHRELIGKPVWQALPEIKGQGYDTLLDNVFHKREPFVGRSMKVQVQRVANGPVTERFVDLLYQPLVDETGQTTGIFVQGHDVSDVHAAQLAEAESAERLSEGMNAARMMVWDWEIASRRMMFSDNAALVLGRNENNIDLISQSIPTEDLERLNKERERAIAEKSGYQQIVRFRRPDDGRMLWLDIRGKVRCDADGEPFAVRGVTLDVTERVQAEEDLRDAHRRKDEFLAMLAHELRNPLAPISSAAQLLRHARLDEARLESITSIIIRQVGHITGMVDDLLDVSRVTRGLVSTDMHPHAMQTIVAEAVEQVRPLVDARAHTLAVRLPEAPAHIMGDHKRLVQILTNLLNNAAKYTPDGGSIELSMTADSGTLELQVRDNGIGIAPELLPRVFDLFTQGERSADRAQGGLGVGLAVVKSLADLHGGRIQATSAGLGKGSVFCLSLPLLEYQAKQGPVPDRAPEQAPPAAMRIMVVDDNPDAAAMLSMLLEATGYEVVTENSSEAGLARAAESAPAVCLLDIGLPGMDGYELARRLRALPHMQHAILIAITGYGQEEDRRLALEAGFNHHLVKPVDPDLLATLLLSHANVAPDGKIIAKNAAG